MAYEYHSHKFECGHTFKHYAPQCPHSYRLRGNCEDCTQVDLFGHDNPYMRPGEDLADAVKRRFDEARGKGEE